jgi:predicted SprT family Zn-dependent metalloprotease
VNFIDIYIYIYFAYVQGLGDGVDHLLQHVEHQFCVHHLHANFKGKGFKGKAFKDELWAAARASNATVFQHHMKVIQGMDARAYKYLDDVNSAPWSRHAFSTQSKSEMLLNNLTKTFNAWIKESKDEPLLTMLEMIRGHN